ncbi:MAG TPA: hypothetical protein VK965_07965, partial [Halomonas sp.]|nr:hypothetical protein [Halomonas sp.]
TSPASLSTAALEDAAVQALRRERFREAIAHYKELLKREQRMAWREGLAQAYEGRAQALTEKEMLKEALVMWENRQRLGDAAPLRPAHTALLLRLGHVREATEMVDQAADSLPAGEQVALRAQLASRYLSGETEIAASLAAEDPVVVHGAHAQAALTAYCAGDDPALEQALAAIPFRSPYRDWVQILKALQRLPEQPTQATALLAKVADASPFAPLRRAVELSRLPESELLTRLAAVGDSTRRFALTLRGWGPERQALFEEARKLGDAPSPRALLHFLHRHRDNLGEEWVHERGRRLLIENHPTSLEWHREAGGRDLSSAELDQLDAWQAEQQRDDPWHLLESWESLALSLDGSEPPAPGSDQALRIALVLRRFDQDSNILAHTTPSVEPDALDRAVAELVERSLDYDPDAPEAYLRLITYYLNGKELKAARRHLEPALARWPDDIQVLTAALDTAVAGGAFKKAAGFARRILAIDPINTTARERLVKAHLAHARKQIRNARPDLARKELEKATDWDLHGHLREPREIIDALLTLTSDAQAGASALHAVNQRLGDGFASRLVIALDAAAIGKKPKALFAEVGLSRPAAPARDDLIDFFTRLRRHLDSGASLPSEVRAYFETPLKSAARCELSYQELEGICETLRRCHWNAPRQAFARAALKHWKGAPVFVLHAFEAKYPDTPWRANQTEIKRLERALERARETGDTRTAHRLLELLDGLFLMPFEDPQDAPLPPELGQDLGPEDLPMLIEMFGLDRFLDMIGVSRAMKREFKQLEREMGRQALIELLIAGLHSESDESVDDDGNPFNTLDLFS